MKKIVLLCLAGTAVLLSSCNNRAAKQTAETFLQTYYMDLNMDEAALLATPATLETLAVMQRMMFANVNAFNEQFETVNITKAEVKRTVATIYYSVDNVERKLFMRKIEGHWLVDMPAELSSDPSYSLIPTRSRGGFAAAESEPYRAKKSE